MSTLFRQYVFKKCLFPKSCLRQRRYFSYVRKKRFPFGESFFLAIHSMTLRFFAKCSSDFGPEVFSVSFALAFFCPRRPFFCRILRATKFKLVQHFAKVAFVRYFSRISVRSLFFVFIFFCSLNVFKSSLTLLNVSKRRFPTV